jgi:PAS domain S-box-containing protein
LATSLDSSRQKRAAVDTPLGDANLFRTHFEHLSCAAYLFRRSTDDFVLVACNRAAADSPFGDAAGRPGMSARQLAAGSDCELLAELADCAARGVVQKRQIERRGADGATSHLALQMVPLSSDIVALHVDDVSEQRRIDASLRASERKYRTLIDAAHEGICAVDSTGVITYANQRAAAMLGYEPIEMVGRTILEFMDEPARREALRIRERQNGSGVREQYDFRLLRKDRAVIWVSVASSPLLDERRRVVGVVHMIADITGRKRAEDALRDSEARVRALLDANPDMIVRVTRDGTYLDLHMGDPRDEQYLPRPASDFIGRNVREIFAPDFARMHERYRFKALATGKIQRWEYMRPVNGIPRYVEARFIKSGKDEVVITLRDITNRVALEREVISSTERERARIGHDLHDGLAQMLIGAKWALESLLDKLAASGSKHQTDALRARELVARAIAQTSELAQGLSPIRKGGHLVEALQQLAQHSQQLFGISCVLLRHGPPAEVSEATAVHLYRIAQEAITNAVKHGKATHVEIKCERKRARAVLSVTDNGCGIGETTDGSGMGLHIMRYRARAVGGELTVTARPEGGSLVECACPIAAKRIQGAGAPRSASA